MARRKKRTVSSKDQSESTQEVSLGNKLAFLALIVTVVGVIVSAFFGYLAIRQQSQTSSPNFNSTADAISSQNSQTQQAFSTQVELTNQALFATATEISVKQQLLSQGEPVPTPNVRLATMTGSTDLFEIPDTSANPLGKVGGNGKPIYILDTYVDSHNTTWLFIWIPLTASSSLSGWIRFEPYLISTATAFPTPFLGIAGTNLPNEFSVTKWYLKCQVDQITIQIYGVDISHGTPPYQFTFQQFDYTYQPVIKSVTPSGSLSEFVEFEEPVTIRKGAYMHVVLTFNREDGTEATWIDDFYYPLEPSGICP